MDAEMKFAWIPPGTFLMGGNGVNDNPQHRVTISKGFWMGIVPVTQAQWQAVMGYNPSQFRGDDRPVESVSWLDSQEFCQKMAQLTDKPIRLPTEAEWEYACRGGSTSEYWNGNAVDSLGKVGWFNDNSKSETKPVGKLPANPWGLHDVHGNVWEWCQDGYGPLGTVNQIDPKGHQNDNERIVRGGCHSWFFVASIEEYRAAYRGKRGKDERIKYTGIRVCF